MTPKKKIKFSSEKKDWSLLLPELLNLISERLGDSFDASINARSVCNPWRSVFSYPSSGISRTTYSLPSFGGGRGNCTLHDFPVFLFIHRDPTSLQSEYLMGGIVRKDHLEFRSPWSDLTSINICDYQIVPLGRQYKMDGYDPELFKIQYPAVAFLPLTKKGGGEFVVLVGYRYNFYLITSGEDNWKQLEYDSTALCSNIVTFKGRFYVLLDSDELYVIDPNSLEATSLMPPPLELEDYLVIRSYLVPFGDDELYLVQQISPFSGRVICIGRSPIRVSRLDEETGAWVVVSDLGDRVLLIGPWGNRTCSGKDLPDGCGLSGNSVLQTNMGGIITYKNGVDTRHEEDYVHLNYWRSTQQNRVTIPILSASPNPILMNFDTN